MEYTIIVDGKGLVMGRLAAIVAKKLLNGETIAIVNSEEVIISGRREATYKKYFSMVKKGKTTRGPYFPRRPDMFLKRIIRGMLPYKKSKGRDALKRVKCFVGIPKELEGKKTERFKEAETKRVSGFITIKELSKMLGAKV